MADAPTQSMQIGGSAAGLVQNIGSGNTITTTGTVFGTPPEVMTALATIQAALSADPSTKGLADLAMASAKAEKPEKATIGNYLKSALTLARSAPGLADAVAKLGPPIQTVAGWLGDAWASLGG